MIETIELAAGVTLLAVQTEKFKSGCFSFNLMRPHTRPPPRSMLCCRVCCCAARSAGRICAPSRCALTSCTAQRSHARPPARRNEADRLLR